MAITATDLMGLGMPAAQAKYLADGIVFGDSPVGAAVADIAGTLTGTTDGTMVDIAAVATAGGNTYADSAINTAITAINLQNKELLVKVNALLAQLRVAGVIAT
jgi:hypothetical protein